MARRRCISLGSLVLATLSPVLAQNPDHPGQVHLGEGRWGTPDEAREAGLVEWQGRWLPKKLESKLKKWAKDDAKRTSWKDHYKAQTDFYRVRTNVPQFVFELEIRPFLDELGRTYTRVFQDDFGLSGKAARNKDLKIYSSFEEYSRGEPLEDGSPRPRNNPGFIINGAELVTFYEETDPGSFYTTVFHEGAHQFFLSLLPGAELPIWLDEALATWFEGASYSRATSSITFSDLAPDRLLHAQELLAESSRTPQDWFLHVPQSDFTADHYALAWSFLHFLLARLGEERAAFGRFLRAANGSGARPIEDVFAKATGLDLAAIAPEWKPHVMALEHPAPREWVLLAAPKPPAGAPAPAGEDVRDEDFVWSLGGVEIHSLQGFVDRLAARAKDAPLELVLVRFEPSYQHPFAQSRFLRTELGPASAARLQSLGVLPRHGGLRD